MKVWCCPMRPLLYTLAILGILRSGAQIYWTSNWLRVFCPLVYILLNLFLMFAVRHRGLVVLKWAQRTALFCVCASLIPFLLFPVLSASLVASGKLGNITDIDLPDDIDGNWTVPDRRFFMGAVVGLTVELGAAFMIGVELLKYLLVSRIWRLAVDVDVFVNSDHFETP